MPIFLSHQNGPLGKVDNISEAGIPMDLPSREGSMSKLPFLSH